jgi:hypothetical protein
MRRVQAPRDACARRRASRLGCGPHAPRRPFWKLATKLRQSSDACHPAPCQCQNSSSSGSGFVPMLAGQPAWPLLGLGTSRLGTVASALACRRGAPRGRRSGWARAVAPAARAGPRSASQATTHVAWRCAASTAQALSPPETEPRAPGTARARHGRPAADVGLLRASVRGARRRWAAGRGRARWGAAIRRAWRRAGEHTVPAPTLRGGASKPAGSRRRR